MYEHNLLQYQYHLDFFSLGKAPHLLNICLFLGRLLPTLSFCDSDELGLSSSGATSGSASEGITAAATTAANTDAITPAAGMVSSPLSSACWWTHTHRHEQDSTHSTHQGCEICFLASPLFPSLIQPTCEGYSRCETLLFHF